MSIHWFANSELYSSANENDDIENFMECVPDECKFDTKDSYSNDELIFIFKTYNYWMVNDIPDFLISYFMNNRVNKSIFNCFELNERTVIDILLMVSSKKYYDAVIKSKSLSLYKFLLNMNLLVSPLFICLALKNNDLFIYTNKKGHEITDKVNQEILVTENTELIGYMINNNYDFNYNSKTAKLAVKRGNFTLLKLLHEKGVVFDEDICVEAVKIGSVEILEFLHSIGYIFNSRAIKAAVEYRKLDCLKFLHRHNCPVQDDLCYLAIHNETTDNAFFGKRLVLSINIKPCDYSFDNLECFDFLREHGYYLLGATMFFILYRDNLIDGDLEYNEYISKISADHYWLY